MLSVAAFPFLCQEKMNMGKLRIETGTPFSFKDWLEGEDKREE